MNSAAKAAGPPGKVRIIGGTWRRHWLKIPPGSPLRPTADRVRETLFNWLAPWLPGARCLDLFAGTGALGFEAVSRGASHATLVETDAIAADQLVKSAEALGTAAVMVRRMHAHDFLRGPLGDPFAVVFVDPPYASALAEETLALLPRWLAPTAWVYLETAREQAPAFLPEGWRIMREGTTRHTRYTLLESRTVSAS